MIKSTNLCQQVISRNEKRLDEMTNTRANFGLIEEVENKIKQLEERFNLLNQEYQLKIGQIEKQLKNAKVKQNPNKKIFRNNTR